MFIRQINLRLIKEDLFGRQSFIIITPGNKKKDLLKDSF